MSSAAIRAVPASALDRLVQLQNLTQQQYHAGEIFSALEPSAFRTSSRGPDTMLRPPYQGATLGSFSSPPGSVKAFRIGNWARRSGALPLSFSRTFAVGIAFSYLRSFFFAIAKGPSSGSIDFLFSPHCEADLNWVLAMLHLHGLIGRLALVAGLATLSLANNIAYVTDLEVYSLLV